MRKPGSEPRGSPVSTNCMPLLRPEKDNERCSQGVGYRGPAYGRYKHGTVRARYRGEKAVPFSLHPVKDFYQPPFGRPVGGE
jgi:hypothetical protein